MLDDYEKLIEMEGWTFFKEPHGGGMYLFITHDACPKGFQLEVDPKKGECSVMHWKYQRCQRCKAFPPKGIMALYLLIAWETPMSMNEWEADVVVL